MFSKMTAQLGERRKLQVAQSAIGLSVHWFAPFAIAHQVARPALIRELLVFITQVPTEVIWRVEDLVTAINALPPFAVCLQFVLEPLASALISSIGYLTLVKSAHLRELANVYRTLSSDQILHKVEGPCKRVYAMRSPVVRT